ncbi:MAG: methyltransferase [Bacteroidales bacterium]|nr:methyltransferase [Bacteroidales bacterium]
MANERITEGIVRDHFKEDALFKSVKWEEQKSGNKRIAELLKGESKGGGKGNGYPEFIISFPTNSNYLIVVECKATVQKHESKNRDNAKDCAVDGVLHYAKALKDEFNVVAIAVSGQNETELLVSHFYWKKQTEEYSELEDRKLLHIEDYMQIFDDQFFISDFYTRDIAYKARELNEEFHLRSITEDKRCTMVSGMLLALIDKNFAEQYESQPSIKDLGQSMLSAIDAVFEAEEDMVRNKSALIAEFATLLNEPLFAHDTINNTTTHKTESTLSTAKDFIAYLHKYVFPLVKHSNIGYDVLGRFYIEFIRYAQSQQKQGLVLTPPHITELFCDLAEIRISDVVYDPCCGTGGFLVSAMQRMFKIAGNDNKVRRNIRQHQLCGVEMRPAMYAYACSNMRFRGDGKSNLYNGDCFLHEQLIKDNHKPTVAFLNPPYDVGCAGQMKFIEHALNAINPQAEGRVVAIVQMSCAIKDEKDLKAAKARILAKHHLKALLSMPDDLFYPIGVVTCIMVFEANKPNAGRKTWFGYFKDDGFEKRKHLGRIDARDRYSAIKERWLSAYKNQDEIPGLSVRKEVTANDEWCAEAYMETDYSTLCDEDFQKKIREYVAFKFLNE